MRFWLLIALVTVLSGLTPIGARLATSEFPPLTLGFARFGLAGTLLAVTLYLRGGRFALEPRDRPRLWLLGLLCVPINQVGFLYGVHLANATHGGLAYALTPMFIYWMSIAAGQATVKSRYLFATALAFCGAASVVASRSSFALGATDGPSTFIWGDSLLLTAVMSWSLFSVLSRPMIRRYGAMATLSRVFLVGAVMHLPLVATDYLFGALGTFDWAAVTWRGWLGAVQITLLTSYLNYFLWYWIISQYDITRAAVVTNSSFLITVVTEVVAFGEGWSMWVVLGATLTFGSIALISHRVGDSRIEAAPDRSRVD